ncbi:hypothetical protein DMA12_10470 [Amycolatopsis balhimycina DSM 5908]|uniref:Uncharacterized protein n=1 Tax=Amycolatopsis balhimycina DSM 5908 TaxID=1081091 RepID=A0A428WUA2_AMYBA|nr:hypothetical protein [Amycolatopsis balhimycina]RSM46657.1 hypothetical protein DMA12_10470 [Amycolatopsis balhimycina DSM 5908]
MVPTLLGRLETRLFLLVFVGGVVTALLTPVLPVDGPLADRYQATFVVLGTVTVFGIGWELLYHLVMQWRWEKDWPTLFGLLTAVPEGILVWVFAGRGALPWLPGPVPWEAFLIHFGIVWLAVWLFANGPMRVLFVRWRFYGGRIV